MLAFCKKIKDVLLNNQASTQERIIKELNLLLRGFANYYRGAVSKETFSYIRNRVKIYLWRWASRRHPNKSKKWVQNRYYVTVQGGGKKVPAMKSHVISTKTSLDLIFPR